LDGIDVADTQRAIEGDHVELKVRGRRWADLFSQWTEG
jgi:hypothetical protein